MFFLLLSATKGNAFRLLRPAADRQGAITLRGKVVEGKTGKPIPFVNIGVFEKNIGTLSDPDGSFELIIPSQYARDSVIFSSIGFNKKKLPVPQESAKPLTVELVESSDVLHEVVVMARKSANKTRRLGWMGGNDGILPFDTVQGGGAVALLVKSPAIPFRIEKLQVRLLYNSKDTCKLRLHFYAYDSIRKVPSAEFLSQEVMLKETKRFGWMRFDLADYQIVLTERYFLIGFEWIDDRRTRQSLLEGFRDWEKWKKEQYEAGNKNVEFIAAKENGNQRPFYKYHGNMMNWPGFKNLPPFTGLMIQTGKNEETISLKTFERKTSFGKWVEIRSTLNAVVTIKY